MRAPDDSTPRSAPDGQRRFYEGQLDDDTYEGRPSAGRHRGAPANTTRDAVHVGTSGPAVVDAAKRRLRTTTIDVHGHAMTVEHDATVASEDIQVVEFALNRYPKAWFLGAVATGQRTGEGLPTIRMVQQVDMPDAAAAEGLYLPNKNAMYLNMTKLKDPSQTPYLRDNEGQPLQGRAWLERTAIHEFAHFLDDAGTEDTSQFTQMSTFIGPRGAQLGPAAPKRDFGQGQFRRDVIERNKTAGSEAYVSEYDRRSNQGKGAITVEEEETFAELITEVVLGGPARRRELLRRPTLSRLAQAAFAYADHGADERYLSGDRRRPR